MKISIVVPVFYNAENLYPLYEDINEKLFSHNEHSWELVMVNDGSGDKSWDIMKELEDKDKRVKVFSLSRNFGSHAAILCGLSNSTGDCAVVKAADLQEPTEMILNMVDEWKNGYNVVLAVRKGREESWVQSSFANFYYWIVRKTALKEMPKGGFDVYLLDRKVVEVLNKLDEVNSALTAQILWSGFTTKKIYYVRKARITGKSRWTIKKKIKLVTDTLFSFSTMPIAFVAWVGICSILTGAAWSIFVISRKLMGEIPVDGFTTLLIVQIISFGIIMLTLSILGGYIWRTFDASRNRPPYIIEEGEHKKDAEEA